VDGHDANCTPVDLVGRPGVGPIWGVASDDLNATLLAWPPDERIAEHVNADMDVLLVVIAGEGAAVVNGERHRLAPGQALLVEKGASRSIEAGPTGLRYLSIHRRRAPLQIEGTLSS
jgi:quercetin dioxygenase-like cupin family protein